MKNPSRILIVNDLPNNMAALEEELQYQGAAIIKAENDLEALAAFRHKDVTMAIIDTRMLEINNYELLKRLQSDDRTSRIPIIFITDCPMEENKELDSYKIGPFDSLKKPVDPKVLSRKIKGLIKFHELNMKIENAAREWKTAFDGITDLIALVDTDNRILRCNRAMRVFLNMPYEEIIGQTYSELLHKQEDITLECPFARMMKSRRKESVILPFEDSFFEDEVHPVLDDDDEVIGAVHVLRDITSKINIEEEMIN